MNSKKDSPTPASPSFPWGAVLRWGVAFVLLFLVIRSGKLSLADVKLFLEKPRAALMCLLILIGVTTLTFARWRLLLEALGLRMSFATTFRLGMLGQFFSTVIPGTVGGDLVKAVYVARRYPEQKTRAVMTLFLDRFIGLLGIVILGGGVFLVGRARLAALPQARVVSVFGWGLCLGAVAILTAFILFPLLSSRLPSEPPRFLRKLPGHSAWEQLWLAALAYRDQPQVPWLALILSIFTHSCNVAVIYTVARAVHGPGPWGAINPSTFALGTVLGLCAMAIPIAPLGLGVGQMAFAAIFTAVGAPSAAFGSALITGYQIVQFCWNLTGCIAFLTYREEVAALPPPLEKAWVQSGR